MESPVPGNWHAGFGGAARGNAPTETSGTAPLADSHNRLHWIRDVTFDEDRCRVRTGHGAEIMAILRNLAISLLRLAGWDNIAAGLRHTSRDINRAANLLLTS